MREFHHYNNTSNKRGNLNRKHTEVLLNLSFSQNRRPSSEEKYLYPELPTKYYENSLRNRSCIIFPLCLAEYEGLETFIAALDLRYEMPKRSNATTILMKI